MMISNDDDMPFPLMAGTPKWFPCLISFFHDTLLRQGMKTTFDEDIEGIIYLLTPKGDEVEKAFGGCRVRTSLQFIFDGIR